MNKKEALLVLVKNSYYLDEKTKFNLLANIDSLTEDEIEAIGKFLAIEKRLAIEQASSLNAAIHKNLHAPN